MDARTLEALKASIAKWEKNAEAETPEEYLLGNKTCSLCQIFNNWKEQAGNLGCAGCPVGDAGFLYCEGSPYESAIEAYHEWDDAHDGGQRAAARAAALAEVAFLKSLLPSDEAAS